MGGVYKNAAITIAASEAEDGRQGCSNPRSVTQEPVQLPYVRNCELSHCSQVIYASLFTDEEDGGLNLCPLGQRK